MGNNVKIGGNGVFHSEMAQLCKTFRKFAV